MKTKDIVNISVFVTLLAVCAWICIPLTVPITMQTFAVFLAVLVLGGKKGTIVIFTYLLLGIIGIPVFSGGTAGLGVLFGTAGGYLTGWLFISIFMWIGERIKTLTLREKIGLMLLGLSACYAFGTWWFSCFYVQSVEILSVCVIPFIIPDIVKLGMALAVSKRIKPYLN